MVWVAGSGQTKPLKPEGLTLNAKPHALNPKGQDNFAVQFSRKQPKLLGVSSEEDGTERRTRASMVVLHWHVVFHKAPESSAACHLLCQVQHVQAPNYRSDDS